MRIFQRLFSALLILAVLPGMLLLPADAANSGYELTVLKVQKLTEGTAFTGEEAEVTRADKGDIVVLTIGFRNGSTAAVDISGYAATLYYDATKVTPYTGTSPFVRNPYQISGDLMDQETYAWSGVGNTNTENTVVAVAAAGTAYYTLKAGESLVLARMAFRILDSGAAFTFDTDVTKTSVTGSTGKPLSLAPLADFRLSAASNVYALLYTDGAMVFQNGSTPETGKTLSKAYNVDLEAEYDYENRILPPWRDARKEIRTVRFAAPLAPKSTSLWFDECENLTRIDHIKNLDTSRVVDMSSMFYGCSALSALDVSGFDTSKVEDMDGMFVNCSALKTLDVSGFDTSAATDLSSMFFGCSALSALNVSGWNTSNAEDMNYMFHACAGLRTLDISGFDTSNVTDMSGMFSGCTGLTALDVSGFDTSKVTDMSSMFYGCSALKTVYASGKFTTAAVTNSENMFAGCAALSGGNGAKFDSGHVGAEYARLDAPSAPGYFTAKTAQAFDVARDAYAFGNSMADFGYSSRGPGSKSYPIPPESFFLIFGKTVAGKAQYARVAKTSVWSGNCAGMSASAALFFADKNLNPSDFGKGSVYALSVGDKNAEMSVRTFVEAMQTAQYTEAFARARRDRSFSHGQTLNPLYQAVKEAAGKGRPTLLAIVKNRVGGHALLGIGTEDVSDTESRIRVYDCNHPGQLRYLTLRKSGNDWNAWSYDMGGYGLWGDASSSIAYVPYEVLENIWENRGNPKVMNQTLTVNAENLSIVNYDEEEVAKLVDGQLVTDRADVFEMPELSMRWPKERTIFLPKDYYSITSGDDITLEASMTDQRMSASITTSASTVSFAVDDETKSNSVMVENASVTDTYSISLESDFEDIRYKNVTLSGTGQGQTIEISLNQDGAPAFSNCNIESLSINGAAQITYVITAYAGTGGSISPAGDTRVPAGEERKFVITPDPGYAIQSVRVDGSDLGPLPEYTFRNVITKHNISVTFVKNPYAITAATAEKVTVSNPEAVTLAVSYFDADGKFLSAFTQNVPANAGTVSHSAPAGTRTARVMLFDAACRPLCAPYPVSIG
ncbi:MAG: DUF285 domain-containing protein [Oscillibacter sp.]|nr:DUF285 domain-containing protein [Oscillibacter sp.]